MKLCIKESNYPESVKNAIKAYTAQGGQYSSKYLYSTEERKILIDYISNTIITLNNNIYRGIWLSDKDWNDMFYSWYDEENKPLRLNSLNSFTYDKNRVGSYGRGGSVFVTLIIPKGTKLKALDVSEDSIYDEEEILVINQPLYIDNIEFDESGYRPKVYLKN